MALSLATKREIDIVINDYEDVKSHEYHNNPGEAYNPDYQIKNQQRYNKLSLVEAIKLLVDLLRTWEQQSFIYFFVS